MGFTVEEPKKFEIEEPKQVKKGFDVEPPKRTFVQEVARGLDLPREAFLGDIPFLRKIPSLSSLVPGGEFEGPEGGFEKALVGTTRFGRDVAALGKLGPLKGLANIGAGAAFGAATAESEDPVEILKSAGQSAAGFGAIGAFTKFFPPLVKGAVKRLPEGIKASGRKLGKAISVRLPKFTPITNMIRSSRAGIRSKKREGAIIVKELRDNLTPVQRQSLYFMRTKQPVPKNLKNKEILNVLRDKNQREFMKPFAEKVGRYFDDFEANFLDAYGNSNSFIKQYLPQAYKGFKDKKQISNLSRFIVNAKNLKQRKLTLDKAVNNLGLEPNLDVADLTAFYASTVPEALYNLSFLKTIKGGRGSDGTKFFVGLKAGQKAGLKERGWKTIDHPLLRKGLGVKTKAGKTLIRQEPVWVHPDIADEIKTIFSVKSENELLRGVERINRIAKFSQLALSGFHFIAETESAIATGSFSPSLITKSIKAMKEGKPPFLNNPDAAFWIKNGMPLGGPESQLFEEMSEALLQTGKSRILNAGKKILQKPVALNNKFLFEYYIPNLKISAANKLYADALKIPALKGLPPDRIAPMVAQLTNDFFGGQDMTLLLQSPRMQQAMHLALLSPDWFISTLRQATAPFGIGGRSKVENVMREELGKNFWKQGATTLFVGINQMNRLFSKFHYGQPRNLWDNAPGHKTHLFLGVGDDGKEKYLRWGKQFRELPEWFIKPVEKLKGKQAPALRATLEQFYPFAYGDIQKTKGGPLLPHLAARATQAAGTFVPFSLKSTARQMDLNPFSPTFMQGEFNPLSLAFPISDGMKYYRSLQLFKNAIKANDMRAVKEIYRSSLENNLNARSILSRAISTVELEQAGGFPEAQAVFNQLKDLPEEQWSSALSNMQLAPRTRKILKRLIKDHFRIQSELKKEVNLKSIKKLGDVMKIKE